MNCAAYNHFVRIIFVTVLLFTAVGASITSEEKSPTAPLGFQADDRDDGTWVHLSAVQLKTLKSMKGFFVESEDVTADLERKQHQPGRGQTRVQLGKLEQEAQKHVIFDQSSANHGVSALGGIRKRPTFYESPDSKGLVVKPSSVHHKNGAVSPSHLTRRMVTVVSDEATLKDALTNDNAEIELSVAITLTDEIDINGRTGVVMNGNGFKIDGNSSVRCFKIENNAEMSFYNLTITNCHSENVRDLQSQIHHLCCYSPYLFVLSPFAPHFHS